MHIGRATSGSLGRGLLQSPGILHFPPVSGLLLPALLLLPPQTFLLFFLPFQVPY